MPLVLSLPERIDFPVEEELILSLWSRLNAFQKSLDLSRGRKEFTFYDGPPFATGLPHYGHILAGTIKDVVTRYATQTGHFVERRFGWDTHGVPVEMEINKLHGIHGREDVMAMGIARYNAECRGIVMRYAKEWETLVTRMGRWIDFRNDYKTLEPWYMESVWWVFSTLWKKGLVYRSFRVMPYSTGLNTALSNFEAGENFKDAQDPAVVVSFPISRVSALAADAANSASEFGASSKLEGASFLAWTTTPWTLPSNLALCVHPDFSYCVILDSKTQARYILAELRLGQLYPKFNKHMTACSDKIRSAGEGAVRTLRVADTSLSSTSTTGPITAAEKLAFETAARSAREIAARNYKGDEFCVLLRLKGSSLVGCCYSPLFPYFEAEYASRAFKVVADTYVTDDAGTGIVHQAPAFGEDDFRVCDEKAIFDKTSGRIPCPLDENGRFTAEAPDFAGQYLKDADDAICAALKARGRLIDKGSIVHSVGFCPRSETPLIRRVVPSWFVKVESIKERLLANNELTHWASVPDFVKEKRFHNWLRDAHDWNISRTRYWGTTMPIWTNDDYSEVRVFGSIAELEAALGGDAKVTDLHRESVDTLLVPSLTVPGTFLKRVEDVFDCWFESGAMPYAQCHYPFENKEGFEERRFPADFIAEGLDQTRGWFYTLLVLSTALFDKPAFKNVVVNGLVLAEDGKKMSKRLKNYPDPAEIVKKYGADALRLYLINSPVVRAEPLRFREDGVLAVVKDLLLPWYNSLRFLCQNAARLEQGAGDGERFFAYPALARSSQNPMDRWLAASLQGLIAFVRREMAAYRLYSVVPRLVQFIDNLTNWYVRLNRKRLRGAEGDDDARAALSTLHAVLMSVAQLMAPFTPFLAEFMFQRLRHFVLGCDAPPSTPPADPSSIKGADSVHYTSIPSLDSALVDEALEQRVRGMMSAIELGRLARDRRTLPLKTPVRSVTVVCADSDLRTALSTTLRNYVTDELNALDLSVADDERAWVTLRAEPNMAVLGKRLGKDLKAASAEIRALPHEAVAAYLASGRMELASCKASDSSVLGPGDIVVAREVRPEVAARFECVSDKAGSLLIALDALQDDTTRAMGCAREAANRVQKLRKRAGLKVEDIVDVFYTVLPLPRGWAQSSGAAASVEAEAEDIEDAFTLGSAASAAPGEPDAAAPPSAPEAGDLSAQAQWVAGALVSCAALIKETLRRPFLLESERKQTASVLAQGDDAVAGALLRLTITRAEA